LANRRQEGNYGTENRRKSITKELKTKDNFNSKQ